VRRPLGVVDIVYARRGDVSQRALAAQTDGFEHIDPLLGTEESSLVLPIGYKGTWEMQGNYRELVVLAQKGK